MALTRQTDLQRVWAHPRHDHIVFIDKDDRHDYIWYEAPVMRERPPLGADEDEPAGGHFLPQSATGLEKMIFPQFDKAATLRTMSDRRWAEAYSDLGPDGKLVRWSEERVLAAWAANGAAAAKTGTDLHAMMERYMLGAPNTISRGDDNAVCFAMGVVWWEKMQREGFEVFAAEPVVYGGGTLTYPDGRVLPRLAGSIDLILHKDGEPADVVHLVDHKKCKGTLSKYFSSSSKPAFPPMDKVLTQCKQDKWVSQINLYRHVLEGDYGLRVASMRMVVHHEECFPSSRDVMMRWVDVQPLLNLVPTECPAGTRAAATETHPRYEDEIAEKLLGGRTKRLRAV